MPRELLFTARREIGFQEYQERDPAPNEILVETVLSGISHGTEMTIYRGTAPQFEKHFEAGCSWTVPTSGTRWPTGTRRSGASPKSART